MTEAKIRLRCAIYTRKSTEEGLDQSFNLLDAQRAACEAYILSQAGEGWECLPDTYDDGGWSGGNMDRPALKSLLADIGKGRIDIVVVYKVDRLTRSLMDFARIVETFDAHKVSFVSVTQAFNTTSSMGRLTLNVLLSFAQFEREVTGERIRDKIAASKARGMWMGGNIPLGYDLGDRVLLVNAAEANQVRHVFNRYLELDSLVALARDLDRDGICTKRWTARNGKTRGGCRFFAGGLAHILRNRIYLGEVTHKGTTYSGEHEAIIDRDMFEQVQTRLAGNRHRFVNPRSRAAGCPLAGKLFDGDGQPMRPSFGYGRGKKIYRYYISDALLPRGKVAQSDNLRGDRVSAERIERLVQDRLAGLLPAAVQPTDIFAAITRAILGNDRLKVSLDVAALVNNRGCADALIERAQKIDPDAKISDDELHLALDSRPTRRGKTHLPDDPEQHMVLAELVRASHRKLNELNASPLQPEKHRDMRAPINEWTRKRIAIGLLAPDIQKALLKGTAPLELDPDRLLSREIPLEWEDQRRWLGMTV